LKPLTISAEGAYPLLLLDEHLFARQCRVDAYAASGPGGQKRNRKYSAVRIVHPETGLSVVCVETRSQNLNKLTAFRRLKKAIALHLRQDAPAAQFRLHQDLQPIFSQDNAGQINPKNPLYPLFCAALLDALFAAEGRVSDAARLLAISTGKYSRLLGSDRDLFVAANHIRQHFCLNPLHQN
jgi:hypothetical protein